MSQIISQFDWDSNPVTTATVGPNAISVSTSAVSDAGGVGGTNGLNASLSGTPKQNISLTLTGSPTFDVDGIDFSIDYHREESDARFFTRGSSLIIEAGNQFEVTYRVDDGAGGFTTVSSGSAYNIPNDDTYRNYRFYYLPATGEGVLLVDGVQVWSNDGPDNRNMYWVGSGNVVIGQSLDGSGNNDTHLDNMIIGSVTNSALPIDLLEFTVKPVQAAALIEWTTASEINNDYFEIEKSPNGFHWERLATIDGAGNSSNLIKYEFIDDNPFMGISYYRLKQIDYDGTLEVFAPAALNFDNFALSLVEINAFPNPTDDQIILNADYVTCHEIQIFSSAGRLMDRIQIDSLDSVSLIIDTSNYPSGLYIATCGETNIQFIKK